MSNPNFFAAQRSQQTQSLVAQQSSGQPSGAPQTSQFPLLYLIGGASLVLGTALAWYYQQQQKRARRKRHKPDSTPIDYYQAEFNCRPRWTEAANPQPPAPTQTASGGSVTDAGAPCEDSGKPDPPTPTAPPAAMPPASAPKAKPSKPQPPQPLRQRYAEFINHMVAEILKGNVHTKDYIYQQLTAQLEPGTGEVFEQQLLEQATAIQAQMQQQDAVKQARAERQVRALGSLQDAWQKYRQTQEIQTACTGALDQLLSADAQERLSLLVQILDPNQTYIFNREQIEALSKELGDVQEPEADGPTVAELHSLSSGLRQGLSTYTTIEPHLVSWLYERHGEVGFVSSTHGPWRYWLKHVQRPLPQQLFAGQAQNQSALKLAQQQTSVDLSAWVELMVLLRGMQNGLITWFDKQPYSLKAGQDLAATTYLDFAIVWCELSNGFQQAAQLPETSRNSLSQACFQITLQILRTFAQRPNFPLYGGMFASFGGESFRETVKYLDSPMRGLENRQEKARILTVLGYSQQWLGNLEQAESLFQEALTLSRGAGDKACEIASLNHLSRLSISQRCFDKALDLGQRALLFARQAGDTQGETNAIANLGYAEVRQAQQQEHHTLELEPSIERLERGLKLAAKDHDLLSEFFCALGLGMAYLCREQANNAKPFVERSLKAAIRVGYLELQGLSYTSLAEIDYQLQQFTSSVLYAGLGVYLLEQKQTSEERQAANLLMLLRGQLGEEAFQQALQQQRSSFIARIGVDGFDYLRKRFH